MTITTGSSKQIAWAEGIVADKAAEASAHGVTLPTNSDAKFWIDNRNAHAVAFVLAATAPARRPGSTSPVLACDRLVQAVTRAVAHELGLQDFRRDELIEDAEVSQSEDGWIDQTVLDAWIASLPAAA